MVERSEDMAQPSTGTAEEPSAGAAGHHAEAGEKTTKAPSKPVKRVAAAIIYRDNTVLAARRDEAQEMGGLWEFPGGKICLYPVRINTIFLC